MLFPVNSAIDHRAVGPQPEIFSVREMVLKNQTGAIKKKIEGGVKSTFVPWRKSEICATIIAGSVRT